MKISEVLNEAAAPPKTYKVYWGPDQYHALGSYVIDAKSEQEAKKIAKKMYNDIYGPYQWHKNKILYAVEIEKQDLQESMPRTLYHGTLMKFVPTIMKFGILPTVGEFTKKVYAEYMKAGIDLSPVVFAADKTSLGKCISAIIGYMEQHKMPVNADNFYKNSAFVVIKHGEQFMKQKSDDWKDIHHPAQVEPGDWYSHDQIKPTTYLTGDKLRNFLRRNGVDLEIYGIIDRGTWNAEHTRKELK